jgi:hypothetical protein
VGRKGCGLFEDNFLVLSEKGKAKLSDMTSAISPTL